MSEPKNSNAPYIVVVGGGTGAPIVLQGLKGLTPNITALVNMSDSGGSTGELRDEFGVLPPGDIRQCLVALSDYPEWKDIANYRFPGDGPLSGHALGNLILSALELKYKGDFAEAIEKAKELFHVTGRVVPITLDKHTLVMHDGDTKVVGEDKIDRHTIASSKPRISHTPHANINPEAARSIKKADIIVVAPGNPYNSLIPALAVEGAPEAIASSKAKKIMLANLVTKPGQTDGWHVVDYVKTLESYIGDGLFNYVIYNDKPPSSDLVKRYAADGEFPVGIEKERFSEIEAQSIGASLVAGEMGVQNPNDKKIKRTLIRHDPHEVARQIMRIYYS